MDMGNKCDNNRPHLDNKSPLSSISTMSGYFLKAFLGNLLVYWSPGRVLFDFFKVIQ